ncbi:MAG: cysteine desulfurase NifS [Omnitrophica WOR_2 bacterium RIFCSPHIGHO2_01_FULL_48_9]|nr:MAG: cysteine desulfurase NifS [Omnitrophica WOR_2 bacterium RIFCSPHIGHO2_02_FULL_48_11]OGX30001.1 MAG: cysteine desulfurase NifS [Omnitrophica WOR_2 bacterium RIFCSPHIGHO2_01_FULL_48_9]
MQRKYFDYASTTPADPEVVKVMTPYFYEKFGNASSPHSVGREAQKALEDSRETLARFLGANAEEFIFTSGATESNNQAIIGIARQLKNKGKHIVVSQIEHHSVLEPIYYLEKEGYTITYLPVDPVGLVDVQNLKKALTGQTILVCLIQASNEIGTIQSIAEIGTIVREQNIHFHVDAVQTVGHIPVNVKELHADTLSLSAHKFYGPKGVAALYVRKGVRLPSFLMGGGQERGLRASTQNVAGAVGLAKAIQLCQDTMAQEADLQKKLRDTLLNEIPKRIAGVIVNGHRTQRLPNNAHFSFEKVSGESLLMSLDMAGIAASMGSACTSGAMEPSHVLRAIGLSDELAFGSLRVTLGRWTTEEDVDYLLEELPKVVKRLRKV